MTLEIRPMQAADYDEVYSFWKLTEGIGLSKADSREGITVYLERNPGLSLLAWWIPDEADGIPELAGTVLCGHDGRRGLLHHLAVKEKYRRMGIGRKLVDGCLQGLRCQGIDKCHLFVFNYNEGGREFWKTLGWFERTELVLMSVNC